MHGVAEKLQRYGQICMSNILSEHILHMTKEECVDVSPVHNLPKFMPPTVVAVGGGETDEFRRQSRIYTDKCREHGFEVSYLEVENHDHVNVVGELRNLNSPLTSALMYQMGL